MKEDSSIGPKNVASSTRDWAVDKLAIKYTGKRIYVWKGPKKGRVGIVRSINGLYAQVDFDSSSFVGGSSQLLKREDLVTCVWPF